MNSSLAKEVYLSIPPKDEDVASLRVGDSVYLAGLIFTMRDMAHQRLMEQLNRGGKLVEDLNKAVIFHAGPLVEKNEHTGEWKLIGIGPTTSRRMEPFSEEMLGKLGIKIIVGKGGMGEKTRNALTKYHGVYLLAAPGCSVLHAKSVERVLRVNWLDLGVPEAIWVLEVRDWGPLIVAMDSQGNSTFQDIKKKSEKRVEEIFKK